MKIGIPIGVTAPQGGAVSPLVRRQGCILYLDPDYCGTVNGGSIATLPDLSASGNAGSAAGTAMPVYNQRFWRSGRGAANFTTDDWMQLGTPLVAALAGADKPYTLGMVIEVRTPATGQTFLSVASAGSAQTLHYVATGTVTNFRRDDAGSNALRTGQLAMPSTAVVYSAVFSGTTISTWLDGSACHSGSASNVGSCTFGSAFLGRTVTPTSFFGGCIGAVVMYNRALGTADRQAMEAELRQWHYVPGISATGALAASAQTTPTYDGSGEATHPSVIDAGSGNTVCGTKRYAMAMTPLPGGADTYENRSILVSDDGGVTDTWAAPVGLTNPVDPVLGGGLVEADPDIAMDGATCWMVWQSYYGAANTRCFKAQSSADLVTWGTPVVMFDAPAGDVSPSIVKVGSTWHCYYCNAAGNVMRRTASAIDGTWSDAVATTLDLPLMIVPWHIDVIADGSGVLWMTVCAHVDTRLWLARSVDGGLSWSVCHTAMLTGAGGTWNVRLYRASITMLGADVVANGLGCWYGGYTLANAHHIGYTTITVALA